MASVARRPDGRWRARYRDGDGREHAQHFERKIDAERWVAAQRVSVDTGQHVDPRSGRTTLAEYADRWRSAQVHRPSTAALVDSQLRLHVLPQLGARQLVSLRRSEVQAWVRGRSQVLAPATTRQVYRLLATILRSAVEDRMLTTSPCVRIAMPSRDPGQVEPLSVEQVEALVGAAPAHYRALIVLMSGTGLRPGEAFAVSTDRVDFLRRRLRVDRQVSLVSGPPTFAPPKTAASVRTVPLPGVVLEALAAHLSGHATGPEGVLFPSGTGGLIRRNRFHETIWQPTVARAGLPAGTRLHDLRHFYASLLIRHGESVKTVQDRLGHASATETLNTYAHLWPDSEDRTREAVDAVLLRPPADYLRTETLR